MAARSSLLLAGFAALANSQTLMLSACTRVGNEEYCLGPGGTSILWTSYASSVPASTPAPTSASATSSVATASSSSITAVTGCHMHETVQYCMAGTSEYQVMITATATEELPAQYTGCHSHGTEMYCFDDTGEEYVVVPESQEATESESGETHDHEDEGESSSSSSGGTNCHFHAGVEHCVGAGESESGSSSSSCQRTDRDYNVPLRIGLLFVVMATSGIAVFTPIFLSSFIQNKAVNFALVILKQFGTGIMVSTAFIHLFTHANLMFSSECIDYVVEYEGTAAAVMMAGIFLAFLVEYIGARILYWRHDKRLAAASAAHIHGSEGSLDQETVESQKAAATATANNSANANNPTLANLAGCGSSLQHVYPGQEKLAVTVMETGIIFHSLLIGLTLVVSGDSFFLTLFIVIVFHQMFEGIALGARIAELPSTSPSSDPHHLGKPTTMATKLVMGAAFTLVTPVGMAIGIGVLDRFNGNDAATLVAIGTLDALSAGILAWVSLVEMWAGDWLHVSLAHAPVGRTVAAGAALVAGMALMSLLGKWA